MLESLFDLKETDEFSQLFDPKKYPWQWLDVLPGFIRENFDESGVLPLGDIKYHEAGGPIYVGPGTRIMSGVVIYGPAFIGPGCIIGHNVLIRDGALIADGCILGHCVEVKHSILLDHTHCGHRNFIGDSVIGRNVNFGDGAGTANLRGDRDPKKTIKVTWDGRVLDTGLRKFGALVGDGSSISCRATLNPGTILGKDCLVLPNVSVSRTHPARSQFSNPEPIVTQRKH